MPSTPISLLATEPQARGALFTSLLGDYFLTLGYDECRFSIQQAGREVDVLARHRTERRQVVAECKAHARLIGGSDINKFVGVLDSERRKANALETVGYFVSLSGFTETALQQEQDIEPSRLILVDGTELARNLITGRVIVSLAVAAERAGRCIEASGLQHLKPDLKASDLVVTELGWIWRVFLTANRRCTHYSLIHADGTALDASLATLVSQADEALGGRLHTLQYLPPVGPAVREEAMRAVKFAYFAYLDAEYGHVTLEGLPADQEVGFRRLDLESLFVPLFVDTSSDAISQSRESSSERRIPVAEVLDERTRLAILAPPGSGKSTLLKRIALAYAFPERRQLLDDKLPDREWFPVVIRCRQLEGLARRPLWDIIRHIPGRAEISDDLDQFSYLVQEGLKFGKVLLLVDGLDEIADEGDRLAFVTQMRTFLATYPAASVIVTSREPGFRIVAGALSSICHHYRLAEFDDASIRQLTLSWHRLIVGDSSTVNLEARRLANAIVRTDRVRRLARNPLLLTTLLLVKRWLGELPRRRSVLYAKAIEVLLMTWNVEAHKPIEQEEALPQLAFVAYSMMANGVQRISLGVLTDLLLNARNRMPEVLGYAKVSVAEFVRTIEDRSSLLIRSGQEIDAGILRPTYEFRHLTFQEYLAALALSEEYFVGEGEGATIQDVIRQHVDDDEWREVIPLAAVLSGRRGHVIVQALMDAVHECMSDDSFGEMARDSRDDALQLRVFLLAQCFADEVQVAPEMAQWALDLVVGCAASRRPPYRIDLSEIASGRYGALLREVLAVRLESHSSYLPNIRATIESWAESIKSFHHR